MPLSCCAKFAPVTVSEMLQSHSLAGKRASCLQAQGAQSSWPMRAQNQWTNLGPSCLERSELMLDGSRKFIGGTSNFIFLPPGSELHEPTSMADVPLSPANDAQSVIR